MEARLDMAALCLKMMQTIVNRCGVDGKTEGWAGGGVRFGCQRSFCPLLRAHLVRRCIRKATGIDLLFWDGDTGIGISVLPVPGAGGQDSGCGVLFPCLAGPWHQSQTRCLEKKESHYG